MNISQYLCQEWRPALGCTEPASIAYAAAVASAQASGGVEEVRLMCDARIYKNCYAVGIPHSNRKTGIRWALAVGCHLPDPSAKLECFKQINDEILVRAQALIEAGKVSVEVDASREELFVDCEVKRAGGAGRAVIEAEHTRLIRIEINDAPQKMASESTTVSSGSMRRKLAELSCGELIDLARTLTDEDRMALRRGAKMNLAISEHGLTLFPRDFVEPVGADRLSRYGKLVCSGVYARMLGEDFVVMSLVGSGNKGITCSVPLFV
jgi:L-cysteine desulfidase